LATAVPCSIKSTVNTCTGTVVKILITCVSVILPQNSCQIRESLSGPRVMNPCLEGESRIHSHRSCVSLPSPVKTDRPDEPMPLLGRLGVRVPWTYSRYFEPEGSYCTQPYSTLDTDSAHTGRLPVATLSTCGLSCQGIAVYYGEKICDHATES